MDAFLVAKPTNVAARRESAAGKGGWNEIFLFVDWKSFYFSVVSIRVAVVVVVVFLLHTLFVAYSVE